MGRRAAKVDANQPEVVTALQGCGATVQYLHAVGDGCPDILVGFRGVNYLIEIKDGAKPPSATKLTTWQEKWHVKWNGQAEVAYGIDDALAIIGVTK